MTTRCQHWSGIHSQTCSQNSEQLFLPVGLCVIHSSFISVVAISVPPTNCHLVSSSYLRIWFPHFHKIVLILTRIGNLVFPFYSYNFVQTGFLLHQVQGDQLNDHLVMVRLSFKFMCLFLPQTSKIIFQLRIDTVDPDFSLWCMFLHWNIFLWGQGLLWH